MIEETILSNLIFFEEFTRRALPYIQKDYFENPVDATVFDLIKTYIDKYNRLPTKEILIIDSEVKTGVNDTLLKDCKALIHSLEKSPQNIEWLLDSTEKWCQERAVFNAMVTALDTIKDTTGKKSKGAIPKLLEDALAVSFDTSIGHDYVDDAEARYAYYHEDLARVPFDIDYFNKVTKGGLPNKTLLVLAGAVGFGKTAMMCHMAAANLILGKNVLYITMEMSEEMIAERIDANLLDVSLDDIRIIPKANFDVRIAKLKQKNVGKLIIKEYPTGGAGAGNFRHLLHELKIKKNFKPDIIYIDYLNICCSSRVKMTANMGMYLYVKNIAEEVRGLAIENNLPIVTATQINRDGFKSESPGMEHTAESFGLPATTDFMWIIIVNDELIENKQVMIRQAKNRYGDPNKPAKFVVGRDLSKMRLFDISEAEQVAHEQTNNLKDTIEGMKEPKSKFDPKKFSDFK